MVGKEGEAEEGNVEAEEEEEEAEGEVVGSDAMKEQEDPFGRVFPNRHRPINGDPGFISMLP